MRCCPCITVVTCLLFVAAAAGAGEKAKTGRWDFRDAEVGALWRGALAGAKRVLDPAGVMNPGVLIDAVPA